MAGGVKFIAVRQSLGMQGGGQARLFARNCSIIILSEICFCFHFSLYSSVCIFVRLWQEAETGGGEGDRRMKTDNAEDTRVQVCVCVRRGAAACEREMQSVRRRFVLACAPVCVSMCSPRPRSPGREKTENEIKGKQLYWRSP